MATAHPFVDASRPLVFAHRGGSALAPENTIAAFDNGLALGADGLELDVQLSRDGAAVVHHDDCLDRTSDRKGRISRYSVDELARVDAGYQFCREGDFPFRGQGCSVPTLAGVLGRYREARIIIEMKQPAPRLVHAVLNDVRNANALDRVCLASAHVRAVRLVRALEPRAATSAAREEIRWALYGSWVGWAKRRPAFLLFQVPEVAGPVRVVSPRFVRLAHDRGVKVQVWTVDSADDMRRLLAWGVDGIITDRPDIAVQVVREIGGGRS